MRVGFTMKNAHRNIIFPIIVFVIIFFFFFNFMWYSSATDTTIKVIKTERIVEASGSGENLTVTSKYLVFTTNETFENTDSWMFGKFNSSDFNGKLLPDKTYKVKVVGWRIPFLSMYRNIVEIY